MFCVDAGYPSSTELEISTLLFEAGRPASKAGPLSSQTRHWIANRRPKQCKTIYVLGLIEKFPGSMAMPVSLHLLNLAEK